MTTDQNATVPTGDADPTAGKTVPPQAVSDREITYALGECAWLMSRSVPHRHVFMADIDWRVLPPLYLGQVRVFRDAKGNAQALVSWAFVSDEVDARLKANIARLQPGDWRSGPHPWIVDVVAPFGGIRQIIDEMTAKVFGGKPVPVLAFGGKTAAEVLADGNAAAAGPKNGKSV